MTTTATRFALKLKNGHYHGQGDTYGGITVSILPLARLYEKPGPAKSIRTTNIRLGDTGYEGAEVVAVAVTYKEGEVVG